MRRDGAIAHWPLDQVTGGLTPDVIGTWPARIHGGVTFTSSGLRSGSPTAARTDGSSGYLEPMGDTTRFQQSPFSIELWYRRESTQMFALLVSTRSSSAVGWDFFIHTLTGHRLVFELGLGDGWAGTPSTPVEVGAIVHLVGTYDGTTARLYVNGTQVATTTGTLAPSTEPFRIGAGRSTLGNPSGYADATFDDVALYDRVLTPAQIAEHAAAR